VRRDVLGQATVVVGIGLVVGLGVALATSRLLSALLFEVSPTDPAALGAGASAPGCRRDCGLVPGVISRI
jgi:hypothetical protein